MKYPKIQTVFKRDPATNFKTLLEGEYSLPEFEYLKDNKWVFTEKVDGMNIRVYYDKEAGVWFAGRTDNADIPASLVNRLRELFPAEKMAKVFYESDSVCLYGEGFGGKIQKGGKYRQEQDFVLFDVMINGNWLKRGDVGDVADSLCIDVVPVLDWGTLGDMVNRAKMGFKSSWGDFPAEGYVARPFIELQTRLGERIITKIKLKDFQ